MDVAASAPDDGKLSFIVEGINIDGDEIKRSVTLPLGEPGSGEDRLAHAGLTISVENEKVLIGTIEFFGPAERRLHQSCFACAPGQRWYMRPSGAAPFT